jgi:hypothetical protein
MRVVLNDLLHRRSDRTTPGQARLDTPLHIFSGKRQAEEKPSEGLATAAVLVQTVSIVSTTETVPSTTVSVVPQTESIVPAIGSV